ncbi:MAG: histidine phosphatase family protein [Alkalispirochaeta sp.]
MILYLIRHGQSGENDGSTGSHDSHLTETGIEQARRTGRWLAGLDRHGLEETPPRTIFTSPARRTLETAREIAAPCGSAMHVLPGLCEYGNLYDDPGLTGAEIRTIVPDATLPDSIRDDRGWASDLQGETKADLLRRVDETIRFLTRTFPPGSEAVAFVSHAHFSGFFLGRLFQIPAEVLSQNRMRIYNSGVAKIEFTGSYKVMHFLNRTSHLGELAIRG